MRYPGLRTTAATRAPTVTLRGACFLAAVLFVSACQGASVETTSNAESSNAESSAAGSPVAASSAPPLLDEGALPFREGDDPALDRLHDACGDEQFTACDELWNRAPTGSAYEEFGATCGGRIQNDARAFGDCAAEQGRDDVPFARGDGDALDALYVDCRDGELQRCDELWFESPVGSEYESFGATCGQRVELGSITEGTCGDSAADISGAPAKEAT